MTAHDRRRDPDRGADELDDIVGALTETQNRILEVTGDAAESLRPRTGTPVLPTAHDFLQSTARQFQQMFADSALGLVTLDATGRITFQNPAALAMLGRTEAETIGHQSHALIHHRRLDGSAYPQEDCPIFRTLADGHARSGDDEWFVRRDGSVFPVEYKCSPIRDADGALTGAVIAFSDITKRKRLELVRDAETQILDLISSGAELDAVLAKIALTAEQALPGSLASVLLLDSSRRHVRCGIAPHLPRPFIDSTVGLEIGPSAGSCGTAMHRRKPVVVEDIATDPLWEGFREAALEHGLRACWSTPALDGAGQPLGAFALYHREPYRPGRDDIEVIGLLTRLLGLAVERGGQLAALRESEQRYRLTVELVPVAIWKEDWSPIFARVTELCGAGVTDVRSYFEAHPDEILELWERCRHVECNAATLRIFGAGDLAELDAGRRAAVASAAGRAQMINVFEAYAKGVRHLEDEIQVVTVEGRPVDALAHMALPAHDDASGGVLVSLMDISRLKKAESGLRERVKELRCLYRVLELATDDTRSIESICGEIVRLLPASLLHDDVAVARIVLDGREYSSPGWASPVSVLEHPIGTEGRVVGSVEIGYPVPRPPQRPDGDVFLDEEHALVAAVALHVERMLADRRRSQSLIQAEKLGAIGELTGGVAHDFNNLLTVILGNSELLGELTDNAEHARIAATIQAAAERGSELTSRMLAFARRQALDPRPTDVNAQLIDMEALLGRTLGEHIEIGTRLAENLWAALIDASQLESAVLNLCINARDAMPTGGRLVIETANVVIDEDYVRSFPEATPGDYVMVAVSDTGAGMTPETVARAFDPFFTTKEAAHGSGLGLSMVYGFVKQSRGHVRIYSEPGDGTVVRLYLPRSTAAADAAPKAAESTEIATGSETVLLVEDDELVRRHVGVQLTKLGYEVISTPDGRAALDVLESGVAVDVLFTDVVMPGGIDGAKLAERARALRPGLPVLFSSGYTEIGIVEDGRLEPGVTLLQKPYRRHELAEKLRLVLDAAG